MCKDCLRVSHNIKANAKLPERLYVNIHTQSQTYIGVYRNSVVEQLFPLSSKLYKRDLTDVKNC